MTGAKILRAARGATRALDTEDSIVSAVGAMCSEIFERNGFSAGDIVSIQFTVTGDLQALNPASALRRASLPIDISRCALFCAQEPSSKGSMPRVIRVLVTAYAREGAAVHHAYLNGAEKLRPDFSESE